MACGREWRVAGPRRHAKIASMLAGCQEHQRHQQKQRYEMDASAFHLGVFLRFQFGEFRYLWQIRHSFGGFHEFFQRGHDFRPRKEFAE